MMVMMMMMNFDGTWQDMQSDFWLENPQTISWTSPYLRGFFFFGLCCENRTAALNQWLPLIPYRSVKIKFLNRNRLNVLLDSIEKMAFSNFRNIAVARLFKSMSNQKYKKAWPALMRKRRQMNFIRDQRGGSEETHRGPDRFAQGKTAKNLIRHAI